MARREATRDDPSIDKSRPKRLFLVWRKAATRQACASGRGSGVDRCRCIGKWVLLAALCGVLIGTPRIAAADDPQTEQERAALLIAQAQTILSSTAPQGLALRRDLPPGRSLTSLLNEIQSANARIGPLALGPTGPLLSRPTTLAAELSTQHFRFHYAPEGADAPASPVTDYLVVAAEACERAWDAHHGNDRWPTPITGAASDGLLDVYVRDLGWGAYGYTLHEAEGEGTGESGFIVVDNDFAGHPTLDVHDALRVTLAHEYHHLVQFAFGYAAEADWFMEQSAVMMEGRTYPEITDRFRYLTFFTSSPYRRLDLSNGSFEYGAWIWPQFLLEHEGWGEAMLVEAWRAWSESSITMLAALDRVLQQRGSSLATAFAEWAVWNAFLGQPDDGTHYEALPSYPCAVWQELTVSRYPADELAPALTHQPEPLGASYVVFEPAAASGHDRLDLKLTSGSGAMTATLIAWPRGGGMPALDAVPLSDGAASLQILGWNEVERACLVISVGPDAPATCAYTVTAHTRMASADVEPDETAFDRLSLSLAPNPSEGRTAIAYALPADGPVVLRLYDAAGRLVETLLDRVESAGSHQIAWDGPSGPDRAAESGVYFCEIRTPSDVRRVRLIRAR